MGNIAIGIKRFFQNKNTVTIVALLAAVGIIYFSYNYRIKLKTEPVNVPYATKVIGPRTLITQEMVSVKKVPGGIVTDNVLTSSNDILGKYVINTGVIPEGSLFYKSMVITWDEIPKSLFEDIPTKDEKGNKYTVYNLPVDDDSTYGNSIFPGNSIDIYFRATDKENGNKVWIGRFIKNIKVLAVVDKSGKSVFETAKDPGKPAYLMFAVPDNIYMLFNKIEGTGAAKLFPVQRNAEYANSEAVATIDAAEFVKFVNDKAVADDIILGGN